MPTISQRIRVSSPYGRAPSYLSWYLDTLGKDADGKTILRLQAPLQHAGLPTGLVLAKDVTASFDYIDDPNSLEHKIKVHWEPEGGGPYPSFDGWISISADEDYGASWLVIEGDYAPPLGPVGALFDLAIGNKIAQATGRELLERLRDAMELAHRNAIVH